MLALSASTSIRCTPPGKLRSAFRTVAVKLSSQPTRVHPLLRTSQPLAPSAAPATIAITRISIKRLRTTEAYVAKRIVAMLSAMSSPAPWPELRVADWRDTYATLLLYTQIIGKIRLALAPKTNQWWNVTLYVYARGLTTSPMPYGDRLISISLDLIDHRVIIEDSDGNVRSMALAPRAVCIFYGELMSLLAGIGVDVRISAQPQECPVTTPF